MARITGIGGVFFKVENDPKELAAWYEKNRGTRSVGANDLGRQKQGKMNRRTLEFRKWRNEDQIRPLAEELRRARRKFRGDYYNSVCPASGRRNFDKKLMYFGSSSAKISRPASMYA
jgi:hypothetical protein